MKKKHSRIIAIVLMTALVAAACGGDDDDEAAPTTTAGAATTATTAAPPEKCTADKVGGTLRYATLAGAPSLDPYDGGNGPQFEALYGYLVRYIPETATYEPELAQSIEPNANVSEWTLKLRPEVKFGNGDPYDAAAVKASMDNILDPASTSRLGTNRAYIKAITVVDPLTLKFTLDSGWGGFPGLLSATGASQSGLGAVRNMKVVNAMGRQAFSTNPGPGGGAGAYVMTKFQPPELIEFAAKKDWWGGLVCIETVQFGIQPGAPQAYDAFKNDELDMVLLQRDPEIHATVKADQPEDQIKEAWLNSGFLLLFNTGVVGSTPPTTDLRVRKAIALAVESDVIGQRAFNGKGSVGKGLINSNTGSLKITAGLPYNATEAKRLVDEVKAEKGWDGSIRLIAAGNPKANAEAAITIAAMMDAVGFKTNLNAALSTAELAQQYAGTKDYDVAAFGVTQDEASLWTGFRQWESSQADTLTGFKEPEMDAALKVLREARGVEAVDKAIVGLQAVWDKFVPGVPYGASPAILAWSDKVKGLRFTGFLPIYSSAYIEK